MTLRMTPESENGGSERTQESTLEETQRSHNSEIIQTPLRELVGANPRTLDVQEAILNAEQRKAEYLSVVCFNQQGVLPLRSSNMSGLKKGVIILCQ